MRNPVDVSALRDQWCEITVALGDTKTQRIARRCCWEAVAHELERYGRIARLRMLEHLFAPDGLRAEAEFAEEIEYRLHTLGPQPTAIWLEERLGVRL